MRDLKAQALRGGVAKVCSQGAAFVLRLLSMIVLARLLEPADFGLVGMVTVVTGVFALFRDAGLSLATVQRSVITNGQLSLLFWINILVGAALAILSIASAPFLVAFYGEPRLFWITAALGVGFVLNAAGVQHSAILQRRMQFGTLALIETLAWILSVGVGIGLAIGGLKHWALVGMSLSLPFVSTTGAWLAAAWVPLMPARSAGIGSLVRFGGAVTLNTLIVYVAYNADKLLIGKMFGAAALGIYGRAYQLISIPTENLNSAVGGVAVSALSRLQDDPARFKSFFLKSYSLVLAFTLPVTIACGLFADDIVVVVLGPKWTAAAPIFRIMAPTIVAFAVLNPLGWLLFATGHITRSVRMALIIALVVIAAYVGGIPFGMTGIAVGYSAAMAALAMPMIAWATHKAIVSFHDVLGAMRAPFVSASVAAALSFAASLLLGGSLSPIARLTLGGGALVTSYATMLFFVMEQKTFYLKLLLDSRQALTAGRIEAVEAVAG